MTRPFLAAVAVLALCSWAPPTLGLAKPKATLVLVSPSEIDAQLLLPPPPADGSPRAQAELAEVKRDIAAASPERLAQARWDADHESPEFLSAALGPGFDLKALPATADLLALVQNDASAASRAAKKVYPRKRPWEVDASLPTCSRSDKPMGSYPSGHATLGYSLALAMAHAAPDKAAAVLSRAEGFGYSRLLCAAHFSSDVEGGQALATALIYTLLDKPAFQIKLAAAHKELVARSLTTP